MNLQDFMIATEYRISEGSEYCWSCFGDRAYCLDSFAGWEDGTSAPSATVTFDRGDQTVYMIEVCDYVRQRAYRWINPDFKDAFNKECDERGVPCDEAWDDVAYTDIDVEEDIIEKLTAILAGEEYDDRVVVEITIEDDELLAMAKAAHKMDITLNQFIELALSDFIEKAEFEKRFPGEDFPEDVE